MDEGVRMVILQFSFSNIHIAPRSIKRVNGETPDERLDRKANSTGVMVIAPVEGCSLVEF